MRCERCKASYEQHYAESYDTDWQCLAGFQDEERDENEAGELGCPLHWKTIQKRMKECEEAWLKDKEQWVEWYLKEKKNECRRTKTESHEGII